MGMSSLLEEHEVAGIIHNACAFAYINLLCIEITLISIFMPRPCCTGKNSACLLL